MAQRDHYEILGVRRDSTPDEIKSAFKKLAVQWHPDRHPNDPAAHERFKEINLAYQVLSDPNRRGMYDRFGHRAEEPGSPFGAGGPFPGGFVDISDIAIDGILGDLLGVFGVGRGDKGDIKRDLEIALDVALVAPADAEDAEQVAEDAVDGDVADVHEAARKRPTRPERRARLFGAVAEAVVHRPPVGVGEDLVGQVDLLEALVGARIVLVAVGVVLRHELLERGLDLVGCGVPSDSQHLVVVPLRHPSEAGK